MSACVTGYAPRVGHGIDDRPSRARLDPATAKSVAATLQALATPSRLLILANLQEGPMTVGDLVAAVGMEQPAVSHQLRLLRTMGLVESERRGRHVIYTLFDNHLSELIDQAIFHAEHLGAAPRTRGDDEPA
ncbi:winged helix-turn-helix transcriptional regulator [Nocardioides zeae]|uniref:Winged helix-turn-helix transcriptional regulator n=1 Tax=Nocardioides zeae TaxID=1457234 RepID=A0A6P0HI01_9ACTN|nr:metalloregulator ArsR/SmtB family transcription factor [Nocardioides zeae]NEN78231.1 winged helix-turn-helix transcriptional regulator [Nocardioides zeae]